MIILNICYIRLITFKMSYLGLSKAEDFSLQYTSDHRCRLKDYKNRLYTTYIGGVRFPDGRHFLTDPSEMTIRKMDPTL